MISNEAAMAALEPVLIEWRDAADACWDPDNRVLPLRAPTDEELLRANSASKALLEIVKKLYGEAQASPLVR